MFFSRSLPVSLKAGPARALPLAFVLVSLLAGSAGADELRPLTSLPFEEVASPAGTGSTSPYLASGNGKVHLTWVEAADLKYSTWDGSAWTAPVTIVSDGDLSAGWANVPAFLPLADGTLASAWLRKASGGGEATEVWVSTSNDGKTWAAPLMPHHDGTMTEHGFISLVPDPQEGFWVVWLDGRNHDEGKVGKKAAMMADTELRAALWRGGSFGKEVVLDGRVCDCCQTAAARTASGLAVAYRDRNPQEIRDISLVRYDRTAWGQPVTVHDDQWKIPGCPVSGPAIDAREDRLALAWFTDANDSSKVYVALPDSSRSSLSQVVQIDEGHPLGRANVQWLPDESVLVTWVEQAGDSALVKARRVTATGRKDPAMTLIPTTVERSSGTPALLAHSADVWLAWTDRSNDPGKVRVGRLDLRKWQ